MELSITAVTAHRFLAKALRRLNPHLDRIILAIKSLKLTKPLAEDVVMVTLIDKPLGHIKSVPNGDRILQYEVGFDTTLSLRPRDAKQDDPVLLSNIVEDIGMVLNKCPFSDLDKKLIVDTYEEWKRSTTTV